MEEIATGFIGLVLKALRFVVVELLITEVFYFIGALPTSIITLGKYPKSHDPKETTFDDHVYWVVGIIYMTFLAAYYISTTGSMDF